jgi:hypothetical protein
MTRLTDEEREAAEMIADSDLPLKPFAEALLHEDEESSFSLDSI